ncbi:MAG: hypothetical protein TYPL_0670 [Candidatus Tyloplasma litorale]|nr:MAG: hypothetical protein TYPL_0670 [Mycoplasmatales bacterium]
MLVKLKQVIMFDDSQIFLFFILNIVTILIFGLVYFLTKEFLRIKENKISFSGSMILGSIIGFLILLVYLFVSMQFSIITATPRGHLNLNYNSIYLTPSLMIIIIFSTMLKNKILFPMLLFQVFGYLISINWEFDFDEAYAWKRIFFTLINYFLVLVVFYLLNIKDNLIKNNGVLNLTINLITFISITFLIRLIFFFSIGYINEGDSWILIFISTFYISLFAFFQSLIIFLVEKIYDNFSKLETFSTRDDISYYKMSLAKNKLRNIIDEKKINKGILILFNIKTTDNDKNKISNVLQKIKISTENEYDNPFFFKVNVNHYGIFFELTDNFDLSKSILNNKTENKDSNDELYSLTKIIERIIKEEKVQIIASGSIYGIHSYSIYDLIEYCMFLMSPLIEREKTSPLIIYDFKRVKKRLNESSKVSNLPVESENSNVSFVRGIYDKDDLFYPSINLKWRSENSNVNIEKLLENEIIKKYELELLLRHTSYQTIRQFKNKKGTLLIYYSSYYLSSSFFNINEFYKKTKRYISPEKLVIGLVINKDLRNDNLKENIKKLSLLGFRFALINPFTATQADHNFLNPDFILDPSLEENPLKIKKRKLNLKTNAVILNSNIT